MYETVKNMGLNEAAIEYGILILSRKSETFTYQDIADLCGCSERTVKRYLPIMIEVGRITKSGSRRTGHRYELGKEAILNAEL